MKYFFKNYVVIGLFLLGLTIRLLFTKVPGFSIDMGDWFAWAIRLSNFNFSQFYSKDVFTDYTPGYLYILSLLGFIKENFRLSDANFYYILKIPAIIADLLISLILYQEIKKYVSYKLSLTIFILTILNPAFIFNSAIWGQIDSILSLLLLISIIALKKQGLILSSIFFGLAVLVKPQALALLPLLILFLIRNLNISSIIKLSVPSLLIIYLLALPFFPKSTLTNLANHITNTANEYSYTSLNAYNLWGAIGFWLPDNSGNFPYKNLGAIFLIIYWIIIGYFFMKKRLPIYALAALGTLGFFFLPTRVHERYLYPALIFLILYIGLIKSRILFFLFSLLSFIHLLNLYYVYVYYNEIYYNLPKLLYQPFIYDLLSKNSKNLSLISTLIFILISVTIIKHDKSFNKN